MDDHTRTPEPPARRKHITDEQLRDALEAGWTVREVARRTGWSDSALYARVREQRRLHGPLWGADAPDCPPDPVDELRARLCRPPPSVEETRHLAYHAVHWGLETGTPQSAVLVKAALAVLESTAYTPRPMPGDAAARRQELLRTVVHAITGVDPLAVPEGREFDPLSILDVAAKSDLTPV